MTEQLKRGLLIVVSGPSGVGKDSVLKELLSGAGNFVRSVTTTTRTPREGEADGRDYCFVSRDRFMELVRQGEMLEYTEYNGNFYGSSRKNVEHILADGKNAILKIEVEGAINVKKRYPDAVLVFISPPSWACLEQRLRNRATETDADLESRLEIAKFELSKACEYDYIIVNDFVEACVGRLGAVVTAEGCTSARMREFIEEAYKNA